MVKQILGAKGGGGSEFVTKPDTLRSNDSFEILFGLGSGRWKGLAEGLKGLKVNNVPLENADGSSNFEDVAVVFADGNPLETQLVEFKLGGGGDVQSIGVQLTNPNSSGPGPWITGATTTPGASFIDMRFVVQQLFKQDEKSIRENTANIEIEMRPSNSPTWTNPFIGGTSNSVSYDPDGFNADSNLSGMVIYLSRGMFTSSGTGFQASSNPYLKIVGKTSSAYVKEVRIAVPTEGNYANVTWEVRARLREKDTVDQDENQERRSIAFESIASITGESLGEHDDWRGQVWMQIVGKASDQFNGFPEVTGVYDTKICKTPPTTVWDPIARTFTGTTWDGSYEEHFTRDPAWQIKEFIEDPIHGVAGLQPGSTLDKWDALEASQYFSEQVSDGRGGTHARFNMNLTLNEGRDVNEMLQYLAGAVNSYIEDAGDGQWRLIVDKPEVPKVLFTENNTFGGFNYSHTDVDSRFNDWRGTFLNEDLDYEQDTVRVFDQPDIDANGTRFTEVALIGCTNRQEALRRLMFRLRVSLNEFKIVSFKTNRLGRYLSPLDTILVADEGLNADNLIKSASRIAGHSGTTVTLMRPVRLEVGVNYTMVFTTPSGVVNRTVTNGSGARGDVTTITIDAALPADVIPESSVSLEAVSLPSNPISYRVLSVERSDNDEDEYAVSAAIIDSGKWNAMDNVSEQEILAQESSISIDAPVAPAGGMFDLVTYTTDFQIRRTLNVNWDRPGGAFLEGFRVEYSYNDGPFRLLAEKLSDSIIELEDPQDGFYTFKIISVDRRGVTSEPLSGTVEVVGSQDIHPPTHVRDTGVNLPVSGPYPGYRYTITDGVVPVTMVWDGTNWVEEANYITEGSQIGVENGATVGMTDDEALTVLDIQGDIADLFTTYGSTASAAASADAAQTAANNAQQAETDAAGALAAAEAARDAALISEGNADNSAFAASGSADAAFVSETEAGLSASAAEISRVEATNVLANIPPRRISAEAWTGSLGSSPENAPDLVISGSVGGRDYVDLPDNIHAWHKNVFLAVPGEVYEFKIEAEESTLGYPVDVSVGFWYLDENYTSLAGIDGYQFSSASISSAGIITIRVTVLDRAGMAFVRPVIKGSSGNSNTPRVFAMGVQNVTALAQSEGQASAAAGSASTAAISAGEAGVSASAAETAQTAAEVAEGNAETSASTATTQASLASGSAASASASEILAASYASEAEDRSTPTVGDNFNSEFELPRYWYSNSAQSSELAPSYFATTGGYGPSLKTVAGQQLSVFGERMLVDPTKAYEIEAPVFANGGGMIFYIGFAAYDKDGVLLTGNGGTHTYTAGNNVTPNINTWTVYTGIVKEEGVLNTNFPVGTKYVAPFAYLNYQSTSAGFAYMGYFRINEVTARVDAEASASVASSAAADANADAALASTSETLAAQHASTALGRASTYGITPNAFFDQQGNDWFQGYGTLLNNTPLGTYMLYAANYQGAANVVRASGVRRDFVGKFMPLDPTRKYRVRTRFYVETATKLMYIGHSVLDANGVFLGQKYSVTASGKAPGWHEISSDVITGTGTGGSQFISGAAYVAPFTLANYNNDAGDIAFDYLYIEDVTESETAAASAIISTDQAVIATAQAAAAQSSATLAASLSLDSLLPNPQFSNWPNAGSAPAEWGVTAGTFTRVAGSVSPYALQQTTTGSDLVSVSDFMPNNVFNGGEWVVLEAEVELVSGKLDATAAWIRQLNSTGGSLGDTRFEFYSNPTASGTVVGSGTAGRTYRYSFLVQLGSSTRRLGVYGWTRWASSGGNGPDTTAPTTLNWHKLNVRRATAAEVETQTAIPAIEASVTVNQGAIASIENTAAFYEIETAASGGNNAIARLIAGDGGSAIDLAADRIALYNGGSVIPALTVENGNATFTGELNVGAASGARVNITSNLIRVYDASGTLRVRMGIW